MENTEQKPNEYIHQNLKRSVERKANRTKSTPVFESNGEYTYARNRFFRYGVHIANNRASSQLNSEYVDRAPARKAGRIHSCSPSYAHTISTDSNKRIDPTRIYSRPPNRPQEKEQVGTETESSFINLLNNELNNDGQYIDLIDEGEESEMVVNSCTSLENEGLDNSSEEQKGEGIQETNEMQQA